MLAAERHQRVLVGRGQRVQVAEHQRHGVVAPGHLDLRQAPPAVQPVDQRAQVAEAVPHLGNQHLALRQVGDQAVTFLAEADQGVPLGVHVLHAQPRLAPVAGDRPGERLQPAIRTQAAEMLELLGEHRLLALNLHRRVQVLQAAAAADQTVRAGRCDPVRRGLEDFHRAALVELAAHEGVLEEHLLAGQGVVDKGGLAVQTGDAPTVMAETLDGGGHRRFRQLLLATSSHKSNSVDS